MEQVKAFVVTSKSVGIATIITSPFYFYIGYLLKLSLVFSVLVFYIPAVIFFIHAAICLFQRKKHNLLSKYGGKLAYDFLAKTVYFDCYVMIASVVILLWFI